MTKNDGASKRSIRSKVLAELATNHANEFHAMMAEAYTFEGLVYDRPLTDEEKAAITVAELLAKYPSLSGRVAPVLPFDMDTADPVVVDGDDDEPIVVPLGAGRIDPAFSRS